MNNRAWIAPALITALFVTLTLAIWWPSNFVRLSSFAIGEQFEAYHAALNIERFGWQWAGLQDEATNPDPAAHPYLYTHHGNNGIYFSYLLYKLDSNRFPCRTRCQSSDPPAVCWPRSSVCESLQARSPSQLWQWRCSRWTTS